MSFSVKSWNYLIKISLVVLFGVVIWWQLFHKNQFSEIWAEFQTHLKNGHLFLLILMIVLMPANWLLETAKWRLLLPEHSNLSFRTCLKAVVGGITLSLLTPNRIGEYGGRMLFVPRNIQWSTVIATLAGSFSQNLINIGFGCIGLFSVFLWRDHLGMDSLGWWYLALFIGLGAMLYMYFRMGLIYHWIQRFKLPLFFERGKKYLKLLTTYSRARLSKALAIALLRYLVFSLQFVLILHFFGLEVPFIWTFWGVTIIYLFQTGIPLPPFVDIMARSELALILWQNYAPNELSVMSASFSIWMINLVIPAITGLIAIENINVLKSIGYVQNEKP
jgi:hypothetical protein